VFRQDIPNIWIGSAPANRNLDPIESRQATAGVAFHPWRGMQAIVEAFDKGYRGYPVDPVAPERVLISAAMDFDSPFVTALSAGGRVRAKGVDVGIAQRLGSQVDLSATYSRWDVTQSGLDHVWRPADYDLHHQARLVAAWRPAPRWNFGASWRYASPRPYTPYDAKASIKAGSGRYDVTKINASRYPSYHRLDVRADCKVGIGRASLVFYGEVDNVYNHDNVFFYEWNRSTKTADPGYQWGRMPIAGVRIQF
jgi:outer membrane receptor protein involved in Fe transport